MYCPNCGSQNDDGVNNCANCGAALQENVAQQEQQPQQATAHVNGGAAKSKMVAGLLAILIGSLGVHDFYLGNTKNGIIKLCLTLIGGWLCGIGAAVAAIWGIIDGIQILTGKVTIDANGTPLVD